MAFNAAIAPLNLIDASDSDEWPLHLTRASRPHSRSHCRLDLSPIACLNAHSDDRELQPSSACRTFVYRPARPLTTPFLHLPPTSAPHTSFPPLPLLQSSPLHFHTRMNHLTVMDPATVTVTSSPPASSTPARHSPTRAPAKDVAAVVLGNQLMTPWYASSYPKKLVRDACARDGRLYVCEYCFKYTTDLSKAVGHQV